MADYQEGDLSQIGAQGKTSTGPSASAYGMAGVQILSGFMQAEMVKRQAASQERIAEFNAQLADYDAWKTVAYGNTLIARSQNETDKSRATMKVFAASKGIKIEGSLAEINAENELNSYLNKIDMDNRTTEQAMGYKRQASSIRTNSGMNTIAANLQANSLILGGVAQGVGTIGASAIRNQKVTESDLKLPKATPSGYSTMKPTQSEEPHPWGISLMPGGY